MVFSFCKSKIGWTSCLAVLVLGVALTASGTPSHRVDPKPIIYIDPGHGGHDSGATGAGGTMEKDVVLVLARKMAAELAESHTVILSRKDDYDLQLTRRTET
ncbi:MAG: N-acetylmuramoyl-L-alanine amidase, partial [Deltaproteobacteria bacterium]|nr:N-acetylmuramoyl-L-alanine amidase [Deltaproteobacteria bacterium]